MSHSSRSFSFVVLSCAALAAGCEDHRRRTATPGSGTASGFLSVQGETIADEHGTPVALRGAAFGNAVWSRPTPPATHHDERDFQRIAAMGMNLVRFYLNYGTFETDAAWAAYQGDPAAFPYDEEGFAWIDRNVGWAKAHGVRLLLNMHVPQGGFQSLGEGDALWTVASNQDRLVALWRAIAARYRDEPTILGYDLLNEPLPVASKQQWIDLATRCVRAIREVDPRHIVVVERVNAVGDNWNNDAEMNFFKIDDPNIVYEFHFYQPMEFTHQLAPWLPSFAQATTYPDPNALSVDWGRLRWRHWTFDGTPDAGALRIPDGDTPWTRYNVRYTVTDPTFQIGRPVFMSKQNAGTVYFDDFVLNEYDAQGAFTRQVFSADLETVNDWHLWLETSTASGRAVLSPDGHAGARAIGIAGTDADASLSKDAYFFRVNQGSTYELIYWARGEQSAAGSQSLGRIDFLESPGGVMVRDAALLSSELGKFKAWGHANGVPVYLGEFGCMRAAFERGGLTWVGDMLDVLHEQGIAAWTYHVWHEDYFGIYFGDWNVLPDPANANQPLIDLFTTRLAR